MKILDKLEALERNATTGAVQLGGKRPGHGDTLVLWPALFSMSGELIAYMNSDADAALYAATRNALPALLRVARLAGTCADDLASRLDGRYAGALDFPTMRADYERDMRIVMKLRAALADLEAMP